MADESKEDQVDKSDRRVTIRIPLHLYKKVVEYAEIECLVPGTFIRTVLAKEIKRRGNR
jgi:predicted DNA binding CopG/RHH family protein